MLHAFDHPVATCCDMLRVKNQTSAHAQAQHCCANLAKRLQHHATFTNVAWKIWPFSNLSQKYPTCLNLLENVATGWPNARNTVAPNNVAICCVVNLAIVWPWRYCLPLFDGNKVFNTGGRGKREEGRKKGWEAWALTTRVAFLLYIANQAPTISSLSYLLPRPNDRIISTQHIATLLGAAYYMLWGFGYPVASCCDNWMLLAQIWPFSIVSQQRTAFRNTSQQCGHMFAP